MESNNAKLREALKTIRDKAHEQYINDYGIDTVWIQDVANAALAAPPRNCDIYDAESCRMAYHLHGDGRMSMQAFADWLFAKAEGGAK